MPEFCRVLNYDELARLHGRGACPMAAEAARGSFGAGNPQDRASRSNCGARWTNWATEQSRFLLEQFVPGDIFHVDSIVSEGKVVFAVVHQYGRPPMQVMHEGGVFTTRTVDRASRDWKQLTEDECEARAVAGDGARRYACGVHQGARGRAVLLSRDCGARGRGIHFRPG